MGLGSESKVTQSAHFASDCLLRDHTKRIGGFERPMNNQKRTP